MTRAKVAAWRPSRCCWPCRLAAALAAAEFRLAEAGHTPIYETPAFVATAVRDLLTRHPWRTP